jgi:hypothetical protein
VVSLNGPTGEAKVNFPTQGEKLQIGDIKQVGADARTAIAMKRLAEDKASTSISQLVLWNVSAGLDWPTITQLSRQWANPYEITLARQFAGSLDNLPKGETGRIFVEVKGNDALAGELAKLFKDYSLLGLKVEIGVPASPDGPAISCTIQDSGEAGQNEVAVVVQMSDEQGRAWKSAGKFNLPLVKKEGKVDAVAFTDSVASGVLGRMVRADLVKGKKVKGKDSFTVRIDNYSPLILNGLALAGTSDKAAESSKMLTGVSISPRKSFSLPANTEVVEQLGLKQGVRILAADLSGL